MTTAKKTGGGRRRRARKLVLSALYACHTTGEDPHVVFQRICAKENLAAESIAFAERLFTAAIDHAEEVDSEIRGAVVNWSFERIAFLDKNILRLAVTELLFLGETPPKTAIDEAIELAREFSSGESGKFINGLLDAIYHRRPPAGESPGAS